MKRFRITVSVLPRPNDMKCTKIEKVFALFSIVYICMKWVLTWPRKCLSL